MSNDPFADIRDKRIGDLNEEQKDRANEFWLRAQIGPSDNYWYPHLCSLFRVIDRLREFDVRKIMLDVVPGEDGMGHEVFAKSVDDVVNKLSEMGERLADLEDSPTAQAEAAQPVEPTDAQVALLDPWMRPAAARELLRQVLAAASQPAEAAQPQQPAPEPVALERAARAVADFRHRLSYNDSYVGEPAGALKTLIADLDRALPPRPMLAAPQAPATPSDHNTKGRV